MVKASIDHTPLGRGAAASTARNRKVGGILGWRGRFWQLSSLEPCGGARDQRGLARPGPRFAARTNMKIAYAIVVGLLAAVGHAAAQPTDAPADTVIALERGACERRCAVYSVTIRGDGSVTYEGRHYVRTTGIKRSRISPA
ncbi:MAG TPA: DUF6438 domain-containing protein, partial [Xanthobacteraceae bacterium]